MIIGKQAPRIPCTAPDPAGPAGQRRWTRRQPRAGPPANPELDPPANAAGPRRTPLGLRELGRAYAQNQGRPQPPLLLTNFSAIETGSPSSGTSAQAST